MFYFKRRAYVSVSAIFIALAFLNANTFAQEEKETLNQRLDRLEKQNEELSKALKDRLNLDSPASSKEDADNLLIKNPLDPSVKNVLALPAMGVTAVPGTSKNPVPLKASFKEGFLLESEDKAFTFNIGPMLQFDNGWYSAGPNIQKNLDNPLSDGSDLRRLRINAVGTIYNQFEYRSEVDFSGATDFRTTTADPQAPLFLTDNWLGIKEIPFLGTIRIGHQKEFLTFSNGTSDRYYQFMERPLIFDAFEDGNQFSDGISVSNSFLDKKLQVWLGLFRTGTRTGAFGVGSGRTAFDQRISYFPILELENKKWWVLQAHGTVRDLPENSVNVTNNGVPSGSFKAPNVAYFNRPLVRTGSGFQVPRIVSTPTLFSQDGLTAFSLGSVAAFGPVTLGGEYLGNFLNNAYINTLPGYVSTNGKVAQSIGNQFYDGFYVQALCFLTPGDHQTVNPSNPGFSRVVPVRPLQFRRSADGQIISGPGAWEVKARYDSVNIASPFFGTTSATKSGGSNQAFSCGLNWYWNSNMSMKADYVYTMRETGNPGASGNFSSFGIRNQFEF